MYPGGELELEIRYSTHQANRLRGALPSLESGKSFGWPPVIFNALADGYGLIHCNMKPDATFIDESNKAFAREDAVSSIYVLTETDVYTFYALVISAISLAIIALERVIGFVSYVLNHFRG